MVAVPMLPFLAPVRPPPIDPVKITGLPEILIVAFPPDASDVSEPPLHPVPPQMPAPASIQSPDVAL